MENKLMKLVKRSAKSLAYGDYIDLVAPSIYRGGLFNGQFFFGGNGIDYRFKYMNHNSSIYAYECCPPLAAVINRKAQCYINGLTKIINTQGKESQSPEAKKLKKLLSRPNPLQTWRQFEAQQYIYIMLFGFCITMPVMPAGFEDSSARDAQSLWNIPPYMVVIEESEKLFYQTDITKIIKSITITYKNQTTEIPLKNLFIFKDFVPSSQTLIFPDSRTRALELNINNIIAAYIARGELIKFAGAQGIISPEASDASGPIPLKEQEKIELQEQFKRQYGIQSGQYRYMLAPTAIKWTEIGKATRDLMLFEEIVDDVMRICDGLNYPSPLLNTERGPNVSNTSSFQAQVYADGIIPESTDFYEQWNAYFKTDEVNLEMIKDYSDVPALQDNRVEAGRALYYLNQSNMLLWQNNLITANQVLEANELDPVTGFDIYYDDFVKQGKTFAPTQPPNSNNNNNTQNENEPNPEDNQGK
jgi:hypothetical protein